MDKNSIVLITGGMGAIGKNLIEYLLQNTSICKSNIYVIDNLSSSKLRDFGVNYIWGDIRDKTKLKDIIPISTNYIFHLAANFANQNSVDYPIIDLQVNVEGTINLLEYCNNLPNLNKFVYASSSCIYGASSIMSESNFIYPSETPYAINKFAAELYCDFYREHYGIPTISIRIFNTYGKYENAGKYRNVIPNFINAALLGNDINITGSGNETRDFTYAMDTSQILVKAALSSKFGYYNAGTGIKTKIIDVAMNIKDIIGSKSIIKLIPKRSWDTITDRVSDIQRSKNDLNYEPIYTNLMENLKTVINWHETELLYTK